MALYFRHFIVIAVQGASPTKANTKPNTTTTTWAHPQPWALFALEAFYIRKAIRPGSD